MDRTLGGAERSMPTLAEAQRQLGHRPIVAAGAWGPVLDRARDAGLETVNVRLPDRFMRVPQRAGIGGGAVPDVRPRASGRHEC